MLAGLGPLLSLVRDDTWITTPPRSLQFTVVSIRTELGLTDGHCCARLVRKRQVSREVQTAIFVIYMRLLQNARCGVDHPVEAAARQRTLFSGGGPETGKPRARGP